MLERAPHADVDLTDVGIRYRLTLRNGVLISTTATQTKAADAVFHLPTAAGRRPRR